MTGRPIEVVRRARRMHGKGFRVCEISKGLGIPHQTISDWISGRRRPNREQFQRLEPPEVPIFPGRCTDCGSQMERVFERRGPQLREHFESFWRCPNCGLGVKSVGDRVVSAWLPA